VFPPSSSSPHPRPLPPGGGGVSGPRSGGFFPAGNGRKCWRGAPGRGFVRRTFSPSPAPAPRAFSLGRPPPSPPPPRSLPTRPRRRFLQTSVAAGAAVLGAPAFLRARGAIEKLNIAVIGSGGRGGHNLTHFTGENVIALCDVNENFLNKAAEKLPHARKFRDF